MNKLIYFAILSIILFGCSAKETKENDSTSGKIENAEEINSDKQLNITILLDLSDRIEPTKYPAKPEHFERDVEIVNYFAEMFKRDMEKRGAFKAKGKMKVIFSPRPDDEEINQIASELSIDLSKARNTKDKKKVFDNVSTNFSNNLNRIYSKTIETKNYPGSDVWRFFKNDVVDFAISDEPSYRNILVILTDGYLFHENSKDKKGNRTMSLLPRDVKNNGFRTANWQSKFKEGDYGYITTRNDLENLDVLVLEINPSSKDMDDEDVIKAYLEKWFKEMNVNRFELYNSDLPQYTKTRIDKFLQKNG